MTQYDDVVEYQRQLLEAEKWANGVSLIQVHSLSSMWYDTRPQDTEGGKSVTDIEYSNGVIVRKQNGKILHRFGKALKGEELVKKWSEHECK